MSDKARTRRQLEKRRPNNMQSDNEEPSKSPEPHAKRVRWNAEVEVGILESDVQEEPTAESSDEPASKTVCLAISSQSGRVGGAYYDPVVYKLYVLEDSPESHHHDLTSMLLEQAGADIVLTSSKADDECINLLKRHVDETGGFFQIRPHKEFLPAKGRDKLYSLRLLTDMRITDNEVNRSNSGLSLSLLHAGQGEPLGDPSVQRWNASIRLANHVALDGAPLCSGSIGALLDHLARVRIAAGELDDQGIDGLEIEGIESVALDQVMQINVDALHSLQIFDDESHASIHSDMTKEGLSLFGILNNTRTPLGKALLREWFRRPSISIAVITRRHDAIACFTRPDNTSIAAQMHSNLKGIKNVPRILRTLKTGKVQISDWQGLVTFVFYSVMLRDGISELSHAGNVDVIKRLKRALDAVSFGEIGNVINETINWEESTNAARVCVRPHIDADLDKLKHVYHGIDNVLSKVAERISTIVPPDYASSLNVVYFPQLGFLVSIPMLDRWNETGQVDVLDGWSFQFSSEAQVYFKSPEMHDLDVHIGDIHCSIVDREIEIVEALLDKILTFSDGMAQVCDICAELDCLLSFAEVSSAYDYHRPDLTEDNVLIIRQGRHPLQELTVDTFVPNNTYIIGRGVAPGNYDDSDDVRSDVENPFDEKNGVLVCTGANACGKSVYLKQVALTQFMTQIGCFVPAQSATLGMCDKIFTRIQTRESVSKVQSTFMIDLNQVSLALRNATGRSLIILDEFGKGTLSADGAGLFSGVIKHLVDRDANCPKVLAASHFHELFREDLMNVDEMPITFVHMQILLASSKDRTLDIPNNWEEPVSEDDAETENRVLPGERITYLYRIGKGLGLRSHAAICAEICGIPRRLARRAQYVSHLLSISELGKLLDEKMSVAECVDLEDAEATCRRFLEWDFGTAMNNDECAKDRLSEVLGRVPGDDEN